MIKKALLKTNPKPGNLRFAAQKFLKLKYFFLTLGLSFVLQNVSFAQIRCSPCSASDLVNINFYLADVNGSPFGSGCDLSCESGEVVSGVFLWIHYENNSAADRYAIGAEVTIINDGVPSVATACLPDLAPNGIEDTIVTEIAWICGDEVAVTDQYFSWSTQSAATCIYECMSGNCCMGIKCNEDEPDTVIVEQFTQVACPTDTIANACDFADESAVNVAYTGWASQFIVISDGIGGTTGGNIPTPDFSDWCSGASILASINVTDVCSADSCEATFTINPAPDIIISCPADLFLPACTSPADILTNFNTWLNGFSVGGGCSLSTNSLPNTPPDACMGDTIVFTYTVTDDVCGGSMQCTSQFGVARPLPVAVSCPIAAIRNSCNFANQAALDADYAIWRAQFMVTEAGCGGVGSFVDDPGAPDICTGGTTILTYQVDDGCTNASCVRSYMVQAGSPVTVSCPVSSTTANCAYEDQAAVDAAYNTWKMGFMVTNTGCGTTGYFVNDPGAPDILTGGSVTLEYKANDLCTRDSCMSTFTITTASNVVISCPNDTVANNCDFADQTAVNAAFAAWKSQFVVTDAGCGAIGEFTIDGTAPLLCVGGTVSITYLADDGFSSATCTQTFTLNIAPAVVVSCPGSESHNACDFTSQTEVNDAFTAWRNQFIVTEVGCNATGIFTQDGTAPLRCTGGSVTLIYEATDICGSDNCQATFEIVAAIPVSISCPAPKNVNNCDFLNQTALDADYATWKARFTVTEAGCSGVGSFVNDPGAPDICAGGTTTLIYQIDDGCTMESCTVAYSVMVASPVQVGCPGSLNQSQCAFIDQAALDAAYDSWKMGFAVTSAGCGAVGYFVNDPGAPDLQTGGSVTLEYKANDLCTRDSCMATFTIGASSTVAISCPSDTVANNCDFADQAEVNTAFAAWKSQFMVTDAGCGAIGEFTVDGVAPLLCAGGAVSLTYLADDGFSSATCTQTFTLNIAPAVVVSCPGTVSYNACDFVDQTAVNNAFTAWRNQFMVTEVGCSATGIFTQDGTAPLRCTGGSVTLIYEATDICGSDNCQATFTISAAPQVNVSCPASVSLTSCDFTDQAAVDAAYATWRNQFIVLEAGCSGNGSFDNDPGAPALCIGGTTTLVYRIDDGCTTDFCTSSYTITTAAPVDVSGPGNETWSNCDFLDQAALDSAFLAWKNQFQVDQIGCSNGATFNSNEGAPDITLGGSVNLVFSIEDNCSTDQASATFILSLEDAVAISCPGDVQFVGCSETDQATIDAAYQNWLSQFMITGAGCGATGGFETPPPAAPNQCTGGIVVLTFVADDGFTSVSCTQSFTVIGTPPIVLRCPLDRTFIQCDFTTQAEVDEAFQVWIDHFEVLSEGCGGGTPTDLSGYTAPLLCTGGEVNVIYEYTDGCSTFTCDRTFYLELPDPLMAICPDDYIETSCIPTDESFRIWLGEFSLSGGCEPLSQEYVVEMNGNINTYPTIEDIPSIEGCTTVKVGLNVSGGLSCGFTNTCTATFTYEPESKVLTSCPQPIVIEPCANYEQELLNWGELFTYSGGCDPIVEQFVVSVNGETITVDHLDQAFDLIPTCGGTMNITYKAEDSYGCSSDQCSSSFTILPEEPVFLSCAPPEIILTCEYHIPRFEHWLDEFEWGGGCDLEVICCIQYDDGPITIVTSFEDIPPPSPCGEKLSLTIKINSKCQGFFTCESIYEVKKGDPLEVICPDNFEIPACSSDEEIDQAYAEWKASFNHTGGCEVTADFVGNVPEAPQYCGGTIELAYLAIDGLGCNPDALCVATFTVKKVDQLIFNCPEDVLVEECMNQEEVDDAFEAWLAEFGFEGGCSNDAAFVGGKPKAPAACGGTVEVIYELPNSRSCFITQTCTRSFTILGKDGLPTVIGNVDDLFLGCNEVEVPEPSEIQVIDQCGNNVPLIFSESISFNDSNCLETISRTWTAIAACNENFSVSQSLTRKIDQTAPSLGSNLPEDITVSCDDIPTPVELNPVDDCGILEYGAMDDTVRLGADSCPVSSIIERTYYVMDECGLVTTHVQKIHVSNDGGPIFVNTPEDRCDKPINSNDFRNIIFRPLDVMDPCLGDLSKSEKPIIVYDCLLQAYSITWNANDACGNQSSYTQLICVEDDMITCDIITLDNQKCGGISKYSLQVSNAAPPYTIHWEVLSGDWVILDGADSSVLTVQSRAQDVMLQATVTDINGCTISCAKLLGCDLNGACTFTEEFYGQDSIEECTLNTSTEILKNVLSLGPITIGMSNNFFTANPGDELCLSELLGDAIGEGIPIEGAGNCTNINVNLVEGKSTNPLFNQLLTLALNLQLDSQFHYLRIYDRCIMTMDAEICDISPNATGVPSTIDSFCISESVMNVLGYGFKVGALKHLADSALAGNKVGVPLVELVHTLSSLNRAFSQCRIVHGFGNYELTNPSVNNPILDQQKKNAFTDDNFDILGMRLFPNPAMSNLNVVMNPQENLSGLLVVKDQHGKNIYEEKVQLFTGENIIKLEIENLPQGIYMIQFMNEYVHKIQKFMKM